MKTTATSKTKSHHNPVPFRTYTSFEAILESAKSSERFYSRNIKVTT